MKAETAILVMDLKDSFLTMLPDSESIKKNASLALDTARAAGWPVIYIKPEFRDGTPELHADNKFFSFVKDRMDRAGGNPEDTFAAEIAPREGDFVITKKRISAFCGTELEILLRSQGIRHLVMMGVMASGAVLSTVRDAADRDYRITVISDACGDADQEVFRVLMEKIFPVQAEIITASQIKI